MNGCVVIDDVEAWRAARELLSAAQRCWGRSPAMTRLAEAASQFAAHPAVRGAALGLWAAAETLVDGERPAGAAVRALADAAFVFAMAATAARWVPVGSGRPPTVSALSAEPGR